MSRRELIVRPLPGQQRVFALPFEEPPRQWGSFSVKRKCERGCKQRVKEGDALFKLNRLLYFIGYKMTKKKYGILPYLAVKCCVPCWTNTGRWLFRLFPNASIQVRHTSVNTECNSNAGNKTQETRRTAEMFWREVPLCSSARLLSVSDRCPLCTLPGFLARCTLQPGPVVLLDSKCVSLKILSIFQWFGPLKNFCFPYARVPDFIFLKVSTLSQT